jgi:maltooligosyltrehalose trehalohydrolase
VYNHLGPEGNYLPVFGPYFTPNYHTPWGDSVNFDGPYSDGVRDFFLGSALFWVENCHVDALRLDAVHAVIDTSAIPFLRQLTEVVHQAGRRLHKRVHVTGENDRNDPRFTVVPELGGIGADSQWSDDFHHALHTVLTGENFAYYKDFGKVSHLAKAYTDGFVYDGCYSIHRRRHHGADSRAQHGIRFIVCSQNHDQIGNRAMGDRLSMLLDFSQTKLAAVALLTAPYLPLIFMGEETGAQSPFMYFVSHGEPTLIEAVRKGRATEFHEFFAHGDGPDPQSEETFLKSKLRQNATKEGTMINKLYRNLLGLRKSVPALRPLNKRQTSALPNDLRHTMVLWRDAEEGEVMIFFNFAKESNVFHVAANSGSWKVLLNTETTMYGGADIESGSGMESAGELVMELPASSAIILQRCILPACLDQNTELKTGL